ncbi:MAG: Fic family protein [Rhodoluna sp.]|nr:Fic family protein [Rhodoluna sp.]
MNLKAFPPAVDFAVPEIFRAVIDASNALARLDEIAELLDNSAVFINTIPVLEAQASSEIENVVTTHDSIFKADVASTKTDQDTLLAIRLRKAIIAGTEIATKRGISAKLASMICSEILGREMKLRQQPGTVIQSGGKTIYTPPAPEELKGLLSTWEAYVNREDVLHPLIVMALSHYQFEAIHPFSDGNGRTGRVLNVLHLVANGLLKQPVIQMSQYLFEYRDEYYKRLRDVDSKDAWIPWVLFILEGVRVAAVETATKLKQITMMQLSFAERYETKASLIALIFEKPYVQIGQVVERCGVTRVTAANWLESLERQGALKSLVSGRDKFFINQHLVKALAS